MTTARNSSAPSTTDHGASTAGWAGDEARRFPGRIYRYRVLGMGLGGACIAAVLHEQQPGPAYWTAAVFTCLLWPHLAWWLARRSGNPFRAELRNLLLDSAQAGLWVSLMHFNLLPSVLLLTLVTVDKISTGVPRLWLWSLPAVAGGVLAGGLWTGFAFAPESSMTVVLASLPMLLIHTLAVSLAGSRLVHRIRDKNRQLDALSRIDALTGLDGRRHWQQSVTTALRAHHLGGTPAALLMLDIDHFKATNDRHGHSAGDLLLRQVADILRDRLRAGDNAGRYGGDEFGVVLAGADLAQAHAWAESILRDVRRSVSTGIEDGDRCSISIGLAMVDPLHAEPAQWIDAADAALYRAKRSGRDCVST